MEERMDRWGVQLLVEQGQRFYDEGRFEDALRCCETAGEEAKQMKEMGLAAKAVRLSADALRLLGRPGDALTKYSWILGIAEDPEHRAHVLEERIAFEVVTTFYSWADTALQLPAISVKELFGVLDAGEHFIRWIGKPAWRAGLLLVRSRVQEALGNRDEAIGCAEEGLSLRLRAPEAPGPTLASQRWWLGDLLTRAERPEEARKLYQAVLGESDSNRGDQSAALRGLVACSLSIGDGHAAQRFAEELVRLSEPMGMSFLYMAFADLSCVCFFQDDIAGARAAADRSLALARTLGGAVKLYDANMLAARAALLAGDAAGARAFLDEAEPHAAALDRARGRNDARKTLESHRAALAELEAASFKTPSEATGDSPPDSSGSTRVISDPAD